MEAAPPYLRGAATGLWLGRGQLAKTNAEQVGKARRILEELGLSVAQRLHLGAQQHQPSLVGLANEVIPAGFRVADLRKGMLFTCGHGGASGLPADGRKPQRGTA